MAVVGSRVCGAGADIGRHPRDDGRHGSLCDDVQHPRVPRAQRRHRRRCRDGKLAAAEASPDAGTGRRGRGRETGTTVPGEVQVAEAHRRVAVRADRREDEATRTVGSDDGVPCCH